MQSLRIKTGRWYKIKFQNLGEGPQVPNYSTIDQNPGEDQQVPSYRSTDQNLGEDQQARSCSKTDQSPEGDQPAGQAVEAQAGGGLGEGAPGSGATREGRHLLRGTPIHGAYPHNNNNNKAPLAHIDSIR